MKNLFTVVCAAFALLVVPAIAMGHDGELNDPSEPGSVLVFPKFLTGTVQTEQGTLARTEIEISVICPKGTTCVDGTNVFLRAHWVCPGDVLTACRETDFNLRVTVRGSLWFNPEGDGQLPNNFPTVPRAPCKEGYLIVWVVNNVGQPIKYDGLIGDAVVRKGSFDAAAYNAIPIQASSALATNAVVPLGAGGSLVFDGRDNHYKAATGTIIGTVRYDRPRSDRRGPIQTSLTLLTLDVRSNNFNFPVFVDLDFFSDNERLNSTFTSFFCWTEVRLRDIDFNLNETFMGRKGLVQSTEATKVPFLGINDTSGSVTLLGIVETNEFVPALERVEDDADPFILLRGYMYSLYNDSTAVTTVFSPR
jgi:hypothetical protein